MNATPLSGFRPIRPDRHRVDVIDAVFFALMVGCWIAAYCAFCPAEPSHPVRHVAMEQTRG